MEKKDISLTDWKRILLGKAPLEFLLEVLIRASIIYCLLWIVVKLLGKRMSGRLTIAEWAVMLSVGALISLPMQAPERGLLHAVTLLLFVFVMERVQMAWSYRSRKVESALLGKISMLVKDGVMDKRAMRQLQLSKQQLFAVLRNAQVSQLGMVKRVYQEATGEFSIYKRESPAPGLSILPAGDKSIRQTQHPAGNDMFACSECGYTKPIPEETAPTACPSCGHGQWVRAVE